MDLLLLLSFDFMLIDDLGLLMPLILTDFELRAFKGSRRLLLLKVLVIDHLNNLIKSSIHGLRLRLVSLYTGLEAICVNL